MPPLSDQHLRPGGHGVAGCAAPAAENPEAVGRRRRRAEELWSSCWSGLRARRGFVPAAMAWWLCGPAAPLDPTRSLSDACLALLAVAALWAVLAICARFLRTFLAPQEAEPNQQEELEILEQSRTEPRGCWPDSVPAPLAVALVDGLLLCLLQEPLTDPGPPHIQDLLARLQAVSDRLDLVGSDPEGGGSALTDKVTLIHSYLKQRTGSLQRLVRQQEDFEGGVQELLEGLDQLWAQLEELHAGVTLSKGRRGSRDLASALADAEALQDVLSGYRNELQSCRARLKDSTQLLQELTWNHAHMSARVGGAESIWPELLLQTNMEQLEGVQENFSSLEQQISTFQTHLEGLDQDGPAGSSGSSRRSSPAPSGRSSDVSPQSRASTAAFDDADEDVDPLPSLCQRSALGLTSAFDRLRKPGRRK